MKAACPLAAQKHVGGFPIQIDGDGTILKGGPKGLRGHHLSEVGNYFQSERDGRTRHGKERFDREFSSRSYKQAVAHQAERWDIEPREYADIADEVWRDTAERIEKREQAKSEARRRLGATAGDIARLENQGIDSGSKNSVKGLDTVGRTLASEYPELGWGEGYGSGDDQDYGALVWDLIREGKQSVPARTSAAYHAKVEEYLENALSKAGHKFGQEYEYDPSQFSAEFDESKHPRGQPDNAGQFRPGKGGEKNPSQPSDDQRKAKKVRNRLLGKIHSRITAGIQKLPTEVAATYQCELKSVFDNMAPRPLALAEKNIKQFVFAATPEELHDILIKIDPDAPEDAGGMFHSPTGVFYADGAMANIEIGEIYAHEVGHAIDRHERFSSTAQWQAIFQAEFAKGQFSMYAAIHPKEAFAEFARSMFSPHRNLRASAKRMFSQAFAFWQSRGLT